VRDFLWGKDAWKERFQPWTRSADRCACSVMIRCALPWASAWKDSNRSSMQGRNSSS